MAKEGLEWRMNMPDGKLEKLEPESAGMANRVGTFVVKLRSFLQKAWNLGVSEPKKVMHCLKVGLALTLVSLFYYMRPLYDGVGGNAMWAVMTVVVVFEYTVGATLCKSINRAIATFLAGLLGIGVHWVARQSGEHFEPVILGVSVFLLASAATFSRFIPQIKARFDYGAVVFILTFSLVSISGYRVDELLVLAHTRVSTIAIGTAICIIISMLFWPLWSGNELHFLIHRNIEKLADSLDGCVAEYFDKETSDGDSSKKMQGYKCVLNSKATEESMANFARWEPAHGHFNFGHPWKQYLKIGAAMRDCACCIESLSSCINSEIQVPKFVKKNFSDVCMRLSFHCSKVLKELAITMKTMTDSSSKTDFSVGDMNYAVQELQNALKALPNPLLLPPLPEIIAGGEPFTIDSTVSLIQILPMATTVSLLIEIAARIEGIVDAVDDLAALAEFRPASDEKSKQSESRTDTTDGETIRTLQKV